MEMRRIQNVVPSAYRRERRNEVISNNRRDDSARPVQEEPFEISANTLHMLDEAMQNLKEGRVSEPITLD